MKDICEGRMSADVMVKACIRQYKAVYEQSEERMDILKAVSSPISFFISFFD